MITLDVNITTALNTSVVRSIVPKISHFSIINSNRHIYNLVLRLLVVSSVSNKLYMSDYLVSYYSRNMVWAAVLCALLLAPLAFTYAQDRMMMRDTNTEAGPVRALDADSDGDGLDDDSEGASYNNSRSNRSTINVQNNPPQARDRIDALDTDDDGDGIPQATDNVCDGVTCPDGSCAATASECSVFEDRIDANYNNTRSNRSTVRGPSDGDVDGDGFDDTLNERANYNNSRSNKSTVRGPRDTDSDIQNEDYNTPRSNRSRSVDVDSDGDGLDDGTEERVNRIDWRQLRDPRMGLQTAVDNVPENAPARERLLEKLDAVETTVPATMSQQGRLNSTNGGGGGGGRIKVAIDASELRNLDEEEREELRELRDSFASSTPEYRSLRLAERAISDERIEEVAEDENGTSVSYRARMNLFGFIPVERTVRAQQDIESTEPEIDYPWYRIFATTPDTNRIQSFFSEK
jgi:hypothetical protein